MIKLNWFCVISGLILIVVCGFYLIFYHLKLLPLMCGFGIAFGIIDVFVGAKDLIDRKRNFLMKDFDS